MNFAFATVLVILLIFPGYFARIFYLRGRHGKRTGGVSFTDDVAQSILPALLMHLIGGIGVVNALHSMGLSELRFDPEVLLFMLRGDKFEDWKGVPSLRENVNASMLPFLWYTAYINLLAMLIGALLRETTFRLGFGKGQDLLRANNAWYYKLDHSFITKVYESRLQQAIDQVVADMNASGASIEKQNVKASMAILLDCLIEIKEASYLVKGQLQEFATRPDDGLAWVELSKPSRRKLSDDMNKDRSRDFLILGDGLIIPYDQVRNMNISYKIFIEIAG